MNTVEAIISFFVILGVIIIIADAIPIIIKWILSQSEHFNNGGKTND